MKGPGTTLRGGEWAVKYEDDEGVALSHEASAGGLGIKVEDQNDWVADQMSAQQAAYIPSSTLTSPSAAISLKRGHLDVEVEDEKEDESEGEDGVGSKVRIVDPSVMGDPDDWVAKVEDMEMEQSEKVLEMVRKEFDEQLDVWDTTMVAEYSEEIFEYMGQLEVSRQHGAGRGLRRCWADEVALLQEACMPNPRYMEHQTEIEW